MMNYFELPESTVVIRNVAKNSFDSFLSSKQKSSLYRIVHKITWANKLSRETINLSGNNIKEIQFFKIELKEKNDIKELLNAFDKAIPYHIVFVLEYGEDLLVSTAEKHLHPTINNQSVIDWRFQTEWIEKYNFSITIDLKSSLDDVFQNVCSQITGKNYHVKTKLHDIVENERQIAILNKEISIIKNAISNSKSFKKKVELNMQLKEKQMLLAIQTDKLEVNK